MGHMWGHKHLCIDGKHGVKGDQQHSRMHIDIHKKITTEEIFFNIYLV